MYRYVDLDLVDLLSMLKYTHVDYVDLINVYVEHCRTVHVHVHVGI